ncbi:LTA synthase family protein [Chitinophaga agrisoli]|uniref:LTA synthase family protein n=1 Tax=Chitinophaga agrisoli TaxID=2607653 RepID=A0A5B2VMJ3_9BACT|nr:LTA synthase family protein [Chitinophaga agrisoli]KAA2240205.1 LTA synthase family protein [Chitinophaga agrisoli]
MKIAPLHQWIPAFNRFLLCSCLWLGLIVLLRAADLLGLWLGGKLPSLPIAVAGHALATDVLTLFCILRWIVIPYLLLYMFISRKIADTIFFLLMGLYAITSLLLIMYFRQTAIPLGADVFGYTWDDIRLTVGAAAGTVQPALVITIVLIFALITGLLILMARRRIRGNRKGFWFVLVCLLFLIIPISESLTANHFRSEFSGNVALNKTGYFLVKAEEHFFPGKRQQDLAALDDAKDNESGKYHYIGGEQYPFLRQANTDNVLGPFLRTDTLQRPNIVIILIEGLGRAFSGPDAYLGSFTPFIDSLATHSLYWQNLLSGGGRTFAVLPTILGSLPFARNGFCELGDKMPPALTLPVIAQSNGYHTRFLYAGNAGFDNMSLFIKKQGADTVIDQGSFGEGYEMLPASGGFSWGHSDKALFQKYLDATPANNSQPRLDVLLTISTHSPFRVPDQACYDAQATARIQSLGLKETELQAHLQYKDVYASILYMDNALRYFFNEYAKRPDYAHTIFLITGDHRLPEIPMRSRIDRYHTLLLLHSPLLQRNASFNAISSHFDITPSLLAYLQGYPQFTAPQQVTWIGNGLDTARAFRNIHHYPLMQTKTDLADYVAGGWMLNHGSLFKILPNMDLEPATDEETNKTLTAGFNRFQQRNDRLLQTNRLIPDSLYKAWKR